MIERGPNSLLDLVLVALAIAVVLVAFYLALRHMLYPGGDLSRPYKTPDPSRRRDTAVRIEVFLDGEQAPYAVLNPPETFHLDTVQLNDGPHVIRRKAIDTDGSISVREVPFTVRNGPGIAVHGIGDNDVGRVSVLANAYSSTVGDTFEPIRIETPAPIPTWAWLLFLAVFAWGMWYLGIELHTRNAELAAAAMPTGTEVATASDEASWKVHRRNRGAGNL